MATKKKTVLIIFPNQLFYPHPLLKQPVDHVYLVEHPKFFTQLRFHKQKLVFHRASMREYSDLLIKKGFQVSTIGYETISTCEDLSTVAENFLVLNPVDHQLRKELEQLMDKKSVTIFETPQFLNEEEDIFERFEGRAHLSLTPFYIAERKRQNILVVKGKPYGNKWSFDPQNRKKMAKDVAIPPLKKFKETPTLNQALQEIENEFPHNPGHLDQWIYPLTHLQAKEWLSDFLHHRFHHFGIYQDAMVESEPLLFHSLLSPLLNSGLLTPEFIVSETIKFSDSHKIPLNSLEGFIRQIIGWREFIRGAYLTHFDLFNTSNFFYHYRPLSKSFWTGNTGIQPVDIMIQKVMENAYLHHIERLMVIGNFMLLSEIDPQQVYQWFMELFIDAYEWVMVPNVFGMSQYSASGVMTTKPYFSSSNYLLKMGDFKKGEWTLIWDALFWNFIHSKQLFLKTNPRLYLMVKQWEKKEPNEQKLFLKVAKNFLN